AHRLRVNRLVGILRDAIERAALSHGSYAPRRLEEAARVALLVFPAVRFERFQIDAAMELQVVGLLDARLRDELARRQVDEAALDTLDLGFRQEHTEDERHHYEDDDGGLDHRAPEGKLR